MWEKVILHRQYVDNISVPSITNILFSLGKPFIRQSTENLSLAALAPGRQNKHRNNGQSSKLPIGSLSSRKAFIRQSTKESEPLAENSTVIALTSSERLAYVVMPPLQSTQETQLYSTIQSHNSVIEHQPRALCSAHL